MIDTVINERYHIEAELGRGGMGVVYRGRDKLLDRTVAVKVLNNSGLGSEGSARLLREAQNAAQLNHPNIVTIYDAGQFRDSPYIVMEYVDGQSLYDHCHHIDHADLGVDTCLITLEEATNIAAQVCYALEHAHSQGIIHRDLKPENILITSEGTAKLMDFGLARSVASRMTVEGTIIGTVFYLAPELALGQEFDGRVDLYALGVMLYEMITSRLPFTAEDPLGVISQHINSPVVPPRAYQEDIPPSLNSLILRLLSKMPDERPKNASEVIEALEQITNSQPVSLVRDYPTSIQPEEISVLDRISRGRLFGREREIKEARATWNNVLSGEGQLLLVSGEPGIGKTRLVRELATQIGVAGGQSLLGECYAEGAAPYEPFAQILRSIFKEDHAENHELPDYVLADLVTISPALRHVFPQVPANPRLDPQAEQQRLFESTINLFSNLAERCPLLLILEDVHWADSGTLALLRHLSRRMRNLSIMMVATYREIELDQYRPFQNVLVDLNRERHSIRLKLTRLNRTQTKAMLEGLFNEEISDEFVNGIFRETEGNPFFIEEVCKSLVEGGKLYYQDGEWHRPSMQELEIPQSVRIAIQSRINNLSLDTQETLTLGAVIGREFDFNTLLAAGEVAEDELIRSLEESERAQLIQEVSPDRGGTFSFVHALIPSTLTETLSGLRLRRYHRQVAQAIQVISPQRFVPLALHYTAGGDLENGLKYTLDAADKARNVFSFDEATKYYIQAGEIAESLNRKGDLMQIYEQIGILQSDINSSRAIDAFSEALILADKPSKIAELKSLIGTTYASIGDERGLVFLEEALQELEPDTQAVALAATYSSIGRFHHYRGQHKKALSFIEQALQIAEPLGEASVLTNIYAYLSGVHQHLAEYEKSIHWAHTVLVFGEAHNYPPAVALGYEFLAEDYFSMGRFEEAYEYAQKNRWLGEKYGMLARVSWADFSLEHIHYGLGNLAQASTSGENALELAQVIGDLRLAIVAEGQLAIIYGDLGDLNKAGEHAHSALNKPGAMDQIFLRCTTLSAMAYWHLLRGDIKAAMPYIEECDCAVAETDSRQVPIFTQYVSAEVLLAAGKLDEAERIVAHQLPISREAPSMIYESRYLELAGQIHHARKNWGEAEIAFGQAAEIQASIESRLSLGRTHYFRGVMRLNKGEAGPAITDLKTALDLFDACQAGYWKDKTRKALAGS